MVRAGGPANLPKPILQRLNSRARRDPQVGRGRKQTSPNRARCRPGSPQDFATFMRDELARWGEVVRKNDIKIE